MAAGCFSRPRPRAGIGRGSHPVGHDSNPSAGWPGSITNGTESDGATIRREIEEESIAAMGGNPVSNAISSRTGIGDTDSHSLGTVAAVS